MFKKHEFTCPDVIYLRKQQKKISLITLAVYGAFFGGLALVGKRAERRIEINSLEEQYAAPPVQE